MLIILNAMKDLQHSSTTLTFSTPLLLCFVGCRSFTIVQDDKPIMAVLHLSIAALLLFILRRLQIFLYRSG